MTVRQERATRTRNTIVLAAASVFDEYGFEAASVSEILARASVTKGAMYFHFSSKKDLARGVLSQQTTQLAVPPTDSKVQELVDVTMFVAHGLLHDPVLRAGTRLALDQGTEDFSDSSPFPLWAELSARLLTEGKERGEVLPGVDSQETADLIVGCFTGIQAVSRVTSDRKDLGRRISVMWQRLLPGIVAPGVLTGLDLAEDRGERIVKAAQAARAAQDADAA